MLQELEGAILRQERSLDLAPTRTRQRSILAGAVGGRGEDVAGEFGERGVGEGELGVGGDVAGEAVGERGLDDDRLPPASGCQVHVRRVDGDAGERGLGQGGATARPRVSDAKHLRTFREEYGRRCRPGLILHTGDVIEWLASGVLAAPWWRVL